jgi:Tol biopolymer transport system component
LVSPNGKWVVYPVTEPSYEKDRSVSDLWLVSADGQTAPRRITNTKAAEADVAWAPDSSNVVFATKREGALFRREPFPVPRVDHLGLG